MSSQGKLLLLKTYLRPHWHRLTLLSLFLIISVGLQIGNPQILRFFIDAATRGSALSVLLIAAVLFLGFGLLQQGIGIVMAYLSSNLAWSTTNQMRGDIVQHCLSLDLSFHNARTPGELIERTDEDVSALNSLLSTFFVQILINLLLLVGIIVVLFVQVWILGLALTLYSLLVLLVIRSTRGAMGPAWGAVWQAKAELHGFVGEHVSGVADIRSSGAIPYVMRRFYEVRRQVFRAYWRAHTISTTISGGTDILLIVGTVGAFVFAALLSQRGVISLGMVYVVVTYTQLLSQPLQNIMDQFDDLQQANAGLARLQELFALQTHVPDGPGVAFPEGPLAVQFDDVSFAYTPDVPVLEHISFTVKPGSVLGILGRTGSGKTTLTRLLFRFYDPTVGTIRLGEHALKDARIADLRQRIGLVTQDVQLFHASVRDNLTFFDPSITDERIIAALNEVNLGSWYATLPGGLDTIISAQTGEETGLSAGEAQLLAFARVFLHQPAVVILDEASSRLDPATERLIEQALEHLFAGRTGIIIAHRLATIQRADTILVLEGGTIREYGEREQLLQDPDSRLNQLLQVGSEEVSV